MTARIAPSPSDGWARGKKKLTSEPSVVEWERLQQSATPMSLPMGGDS